MISSCKQRTGSRAHCGSSGKSGWWWSICCSPLWRGSPRNHILQVQTLLLFLFFLHKYYRQCMQGCLALALRAATTVPTAILGHFRHSEVSGGSAAVCDPSPPRPFARFRRHWRSWRRSPVAFPKAGLIFRHPFPLPESAQTLAAIASRAVGKSGKNFPAASARKPFQQGISDSHSLLEFSERSTTHWKVPFEMSGLKYSSLRLPLSHKKSSLRLDSVTSLDGFWSA